MKRRLIAVCLLLICAAGGFAHADDTDIYTSRILPPSSMPLVMFSLDLSSSIEGQYANCAMTGAGASMCPPAQYFYDRCPTCRPLMPAANMPFRRYDAIRFAIRTALIENGGMKVGLMLPHAAQVNCEGDSALNVCSNGGYIARGFKAVDTVAVPFTSPPLINPGPNLSEFLNILDSIPVDTGRVDHPFQGREMFFELFRYLTGQNIYNSRNGWVDYGTDKLQNLNQDNTAVSWDNSIEVPLANRYLSPLTADLSCSRIFTVNFLLNPSRQESESDAAIDSDVAGGMLGLDLAKKPSLDSVVAYLHDVDLARANQPFGTVPEIQGKQNVTSFFFQRPTPVDSNPPTFDQASLAYAQAGGTNRPQPLNNDPALLVQNLSGVIGQILSVSTTFVAASIPVNVFNRARTLDNVYTALFQADASGKVFWPGNLKKLKFDPVPIACPVGVSGCAAGFDVRLVDALGQGAVGGDGRIKTEALTFWTNPATISANPAKSVMAGRDGRHVDLGGAGQKMPGYLSGNPGANNGNSGARQLYTYPGSGTSLIPLNSDAATATLLRPALNVVSDALALNLLLCVRGNDCLDVDGDGVTSEARPWMMADALHSRPLPINFGAINGHTAENPAIYIAMGTNDGFLHLFRNTSSAGTELGTEMWAFMPVEALDIQNRLALNNVTNSRLYGVDGASSTYIKDVDRDGNIEPADGDRVFLYFGLRRGGRAYYAFDITNPEVPVFLWHIKPSVTPTLGTSAECTASIAAQTASSINSACAAVYNTLPCTGDFCELGYTFAQPRIGNVQLGVDAQGKQVVRPAVFFAGGYDQNKDYAPSLVGLLSSGLPSPGSSNTNDLKGMAIYVVDAETGALIWKAVKGAATGATTNPKVYAHAQLLDSIASTLTIVDTDGDGLVDRVVVGDTGGNLWRADLGGDDDGALNPGQAQVTDDWRLTLLAKLGRHSGIGKVNDRRFFHEPDYVLSKDDAGPFDAIVIGSGNREDPLDYGRVRDASGVQTLPEDALFVLKDRRVATYSASDADPAKVMTPTSLADLTSNCLQGGVSVSCNPALGNGWRIRLSPGTGEKVLSSPLTAAYRVYFSSYVPRPLNDTTSCAPSEGTGLFYAVNLKDGTAVFNFNVADGAGAGGGANSAADRFEALKSSGIPSDPVFVNLSAGAGAEAKCILGSDLTCRAVPGATRFRTHWRRVE